jgi:hypothetical protein
MSSDLSSKIFTLKDREGQAGLPGTTSPPNTTLDGGESEEGFDALGWGSHTMEGSVDGWVDKEIAVSELCEISSSSLDGRRRYVTGKKI